MNDYILKRERSLAAIDTGESNNQIPKVFPVNPAQGSKVHGTVISTTIFCSVKRSDGVHGDGPTRTTTQYQEGNP